MARVITKELALRIVRKLKATRVAALSHAHDIYAVEFDGILIATISIRRGSSKDQGHDHLMRDLHLSPRNAKLLAQCPLSREGYFRLLQDAGLLAAPADELTDGF